LKASWTALQCTYLDGATSATSLTETGFKTGNVLNELETQVFKQLE